MWTQQRWPQRPAMESEPWPNHNRRFPQQQQQQRSILHPRVPSAFVPPRVPFFAANTFPAYPFPSTFQNQEPKALGVHPASQSYYRSSSYRPPHQPSFLNSHHPAVQSNHLYEPGQLYNSGTSHHFYQSPSHRSHSSSSGNQQTYQPHGFQYSPASNLPSPSGTKKLYHAKGTNKFGSSGQPLPLQKPVQVVENHPRSNQDHSGNKISISETMPKHTGIPQTLPLTKRSIVDSAENTSPQIQQSPHFNFTEDIPHSGANVGKSVTVKYNDLSSCERVKGIKIESKALESTNSVSGNTTITECVSTPLETHVHDRMYQQNTYQFLKQMRSEVEKMEIIRDTTSHFLPEPVRKHNLGLLREESQVRKRSISLSSSPVLTKHSELGQMGENSGVNKVDRCQSVSLPFNCQIDSHLCQNSMQQKGHHVSSLSPVLGLETAPTVMEPFKLSKDETVFFKKDCPNYIAELPSFCKDQIKRELISPLLGTQSLSLNRSPSFFGDSSNISLVTRDISGESSLSSPSGFIPEQAGWQLGGTTKVASIEDLPTVQSAAVSSHQHSDSPLMSSCCLEPTPHSEQTLEDLCHLNGKTLAKLSDQYSSVDEKFELERGSLSSPDLLKTPSTCLLQAPSSYLYQTSSSCSLPASNTCLPEASNRCSPQSWNNSTLLAPSTCSTQSTQFGSHVVSAASSSIKFSLPCNSYEKCGKHSSEAERYSHSVKMCQMDASLTKLPNLCFADCKGASSPFISGDVCMKQDGPFSSIHEHEKNMAKYNEKIGKHEKNTGAVVSFVPGLEDILSPRSDSPLLLDAGTMRSQRASVSAVESVISGICKNIAQPTEQHLSCPIERPAKDLKQLHHPLENLYSTSESQNERTTVLLADTDAAYHIKGSSENLTKNNLFFDASPPFTKKELYHIPVEMDSINSIVKCEKSEFLSSSLSLNLNLIPKNVATSDISKMSVEGLHSHINATANLPLVEDQALLSFVEHKIALPFNNDEVTPPVVIGHTTSPLVTGQMTSPLVSDQTASPLVSCLTTSPLVSGKITLPLVGGHTSPVVSGEMSPPSLISFQSTPHLVSIHTTPPLLVGYQTTSSLVSGQTSSRQTSPLVSGQITSPLVNGHTTSSLVSGQTSPLVTGEIVQPVFSGETTLSLCRGEITSSLVSGQTTPPLVIGQTTPPLVSGQTSPLVTGEIVQPVFIGETTLSLCRGGITSSLVSGQTTSSLVSGQTTPPLVSGQITPSLLISGQTTPPPLDINQTEPPGVSNHNTLSLDCDQANKDLLTSSCYPVMAANVTDILENSMVLPAPRLQDKHQYPSPQSETIPASSCLLNDGCSWHQLAEEATARNYYDQSEVPDSVEKSFSANHSMCSKSELTKNGQLALVSLCDSAQISCQITLTSSCDSAPVSCQTELASTFNSPEALSNCPSVQSSSSMTHLHNVQPLLLTSATGPENSDEDNCPHLVSQLLIDASVVNSELESDSEIPLLEEFQPEGVYAASSEHDHLKTCTAELTSRQASHVDVVATSTESTSLLADDSVVSLTPKQKNFSWRKNIKALSLKISTSQANKTLKGRRLKQLDSQERLNHQHFHSDGMGDLSSRRRYTRSSVPPLGKPAEYKHDQKLTKLNCVSSVHSIPLQPTKKNRKGGEAPYVVVGKFKGHHMMKVKIPKLSILPQQSVSANVFEKLSVKDVVRKILPTNRDGLLSCDQSRGVGTYPKLANPGPKLKYENVFEFLNGAQMLETDDRQTLQKDGVCMKTSQNSLPCKKKLEPQASHPVKSHEDNKGCEADTFFADFKDIFIKNFKRNKPTSSEIVKENSSIFFEGVFSSYFQKKLISNMQKFRSCGYSSSSDDEDDVLDGAIFREKTTPPPPLYSSQDTPQNNGDTAAEVVLRENNDEDGHMEIISMNIKESVDQGELTRKSLINKDQAREAANLGCDTKASMEEKRKLPISVSECLEDLGKVGELVVDSDTKIMEQEDTINTYGRDTKLVEQDNAIISSERQTTLMEQEDAFIRSERKTTLLEQDDTIIRSEKQTTSMEQEDTIIRSERKTTLMEQEDFFIRSERQTTLMEQEDTITRSEKQTTILEQDDTIIRSEKDTKESSDNAVPPFMTYSDSVQETEDYLKCQMAFFEDISSDSDSCHTIVTSSVLDSVFQGSISDQGAIPHSTPASFPGSYGGSPLKKYVSLHLVVSNTDTYDNSEGLKDDSLPKPKESQIFHVDSANGKMDMDKSDLKEKSVMLPKSEDEEASQDTLVSPALKDRDESFLRGEFQITRKEFKSCILNSSKGEPLKPSDSVIADVRATAGTGKLQKRSRRSRSTKIVENINDKSNVLDSTQDYLEIDCSLYLSRNLRERKKTCYKQKSAEEINSSEDESSSSSFEEFITPGKGSKRTKARTSKDERLLFKPTQIISDSRRTSRGRQKSRPPRRRKKKGSKGGKLLNSLSLLHMATLANLTETQSNLSSERPLSLNDLSNSQNGMYFSHWKSEMEHNADFSVEDHNLSVSKREAQVNEGETDVRSLQVGQLGHMGPHEKRPANTEVPLTKSLHLQTSLETLNVCCESSNTELHPVSDLVSSSMVPSNFTFNVFGSSDASCSIDESGLSNTLQLLETKRAQVNCASYSMKDILKLTSQDESMDSDSRDSCLLINPSRLPKKPKLSNSSTISQNPHKAVNTDQVHLLKKDEGVSFSGKRKPDLSKSELLVSAATGIATFEPSVNISEQLDQVEARNFMTSSLTRDVDFAGCRTKLSTRKPSSSRFHASLSRTKELKSVSPKIGASTSNPTEKSSSDLTSPAISSDACLLYSTSTLHHNSHLKTPVVCLTRQTSDSVSLGNAVKRPKHPIVQDFPADSTQICQLSDNLETPLELSLYVPKSSLSPTVQDPKTPTSLVAAADISENPSHQLFTEKQDKSLLPNIISFQQRHSPITAHAFNSSHVLDRVQNPLNLASPHPNSWKWSQLQLGSDCAVSPINASGPPVSPNKYSPITPTSPMSPNYPPQTQGTHLSPSERDPAPPPHWFPWVKVTSQAQTSVTLAKPGCKRVSATTTAALKLIHKLEPPLHKVSVQRQLWKENYAVHKSNCMEASTLKPGSAIPGLFASCDKNVAKTAPEFGSEDLNAHCVPSQQSAAGEDVDLRSGASCLVSSPRTYITASRTASESVTPPFSNKDGETHSKKAVNHSRYVRLAGIDMSNDALAENKDDCNMTNKVEV